MNTYKDVARREPAAGRDTESGDRELGMRIWRIMRKKGMDQTSLALASGVSKNIIARLLTGRRLTSFTNIERIATALDVSLDEFRPSAHRPRKGCQTTAQAIDADEPEPDNTDEDGAYGDTISLYR